MHPRNPYKTPINFAVLARSYPKLLPYLIPGRLATTIDFWNSDAQRALTEALLLRDFEIKLALPNDRLCPPVPNRLNYVLWLQDIVKHSPSSRDGIVRGLDIGTGASAIYPLLGCRLEAQWEFVGTDIDEMSFQAACANVEQNGLTDRIRVVKTSPDSPLFASLPADGEIYHFTMCNPPFYADADEVSQSAELKQLPPNSACSGADVEMITPGGEATFVEQMIEESLKHPLRCRWYTSMLGKLSSLARLVHILKDNKIDNYAITEFVQGQTRRWALGWSFYDHRLPDAFARIDNPNSTLQGLLPPRNTMVQPFNRKIDNETRNQTLLECISAIKSVRVTQKVLDPLRLEVSVPGDTWSRKARRLAKTTATSCDVDMNIPVSEQDKSGDGTVMVCEVVWQVVDSIAGGDRLVSYWIRGRERDLFASFCSYVFRKVQTSLQ